MKKKQEDCPMALIDLIGKPKLWRREASKVLISQDQKLRRLEWMVGGSISLAILILTIIAKLALGG